MSELQAYLLTTVVARIMDKSWAALYIYMLAIEISSIINTTEFQTANADRRKSSSTKQRKSAVFSQKHNCRPFSSPCTAVGPMCVRVCL